MGNWYPRRYTVSRKHDIAAAAAPPAYFARRWPDRQRRAVADRTYSAPIGSKAAGAAFEDTWTLDKEDVAWMGLIADQHQDPPPTDNSDNWRSHRVSGIGCMVVGASAVGYGGRFVLVQYRSLSKSEAVNAGDCTVRSTHGLTEEFSPRGVSRSEAGSVSFVGRHGPAIAASARSPPALGTSRRSAGPRSTLPARIAAPAIGQGSARRPRFQELNHMVGQDQLFV